MNQIATAKYRPVLTAEQITRLLALCKNCGILDTVTISCIHTLSVFQTKISNLGITPAYTTSPQPSLMEKLGSPTANNIVPKEQYWKDCYNIYQVDPAGCAVSTIQAAKEHMYLNGLMSPEQLAEFESAEQGEQL